MEKDFTLKKGNTKADAGGRVAVWVTNLFLAELLKTV